MPGQWERRRWLGLRGSRSCLQEKPLWMENDDLIGDNVRIGRRACDGCVQDDRARVMAMSELERQLLLVARLPSAPARVGAGQAIRGEASVR